MKLWRMNEGKDGFPGLSFIGQRRTEAGDRPVRFAVVITQSGETMREKGKNGKEWGR